MKLVNYRYHGESHIGVLAADKVLLPALDAKQPFPYSDMLSLINGGPRRLQQLRDWVDSAPPQASVDLEPQCLQAPIPRPPRNIICLGWNYAAHVKETQAKAPVQKELPKHPVFFTKDVATINGPYDAIPYDAEVSTKIDWEVELAVVIGRHAYKVNTAQALDYVFGYSVVNDLTARDLQKRHRQFFLGKSLRGSCPLGPCIVTREQIPNVQALSIRSRLNGVIKQDDTTANQIFDVATVIAILSNVIALEPGTVIATGTPSGVGYVREPPEYLAPGDVIECEIEGIGVLRNRCIEHV